jgi:hypothetical protein
LLIGRPLASTGFLLLALVRSFSSSPSSVLDSAS